LSKYFSKAKENKKSENIEINTYGIKVNKPNYVMYFLFDFKPSLSMSFLIALLISIKIKIKSKSKSDALIISKYCKFLSDNSI